MDQAAAGMYDIRSLGAHHCVVCPSVCVNEEHVYLQ